MKSKEAALKKLEAFIAGGGGLVNACQVRIQRMPMGPSIARMRFASGRDWEVTEDGAGSLQADGSWLFVTLP